jgi:adenylate cyclase
VFKKTRIGGALNPGELFQPARVAGFLLIAAFAALRFWDAIPLELARNYLFDLYQRAQPRIVEDYPVAIVDIDDRSLREIGQWPWPRSVLAGLVDRIANDGAAAIGFDMVFPERDRLSGSRLADLVPNGDDDLKRRLAGLADNDVLFARSLKQGRAVLGRSALWGAAAADARPAEAAGKASIATIGGDPRGSILRVPAALKNLPELESAASGFGMLTAQPERDGVIRRAPLILSAGDEIAPGLGVELLRVASGASAIVVKRDEAGVRSVVVAGVEIPSDRDGQLWITFTGHDARRYVPAATVLAGNAPEGRFRGKIVLIGTSAAGLFDLKSTPIERVIPGVEIHAQIVESILAGATLNRPNFALGLEVALAIVIGSILVIAAPLLGAVTNLAIGGAIAALLTAASWHLFAAHRTLIDVSYPLASSFGVFLLMTFMNYRREEQRRGQVREAFRQYLSPALVEQLIREPRRLVLGGETREMSIFFSDVRGFTSIAEGFKDNPVGLTALMNRMLTSLSHPIIERRGTIDKYIGDAIMAFWNAPLDDPDHALHACETALDVLERLDALNEERRREALEAGAPFSPLQVGIGISTGLSVVGNMGSDIRFDYSVLGDAVNLASRLEALTAVYGVRILIGAETARQCRGRLAILEVDRVLVKGRMEAETVYAVLGRGDLLAERSFLALQAAFEAMLRNYRCGEWGQALRELESCRKANCPGADKLVDVYAARLAELAKSAPARDWDGVFNAWPAASL